MVSSSGGLSWRRAASAVATVLTAAALLTSRAAPAQQPTDIRLSRYTAASAAPDIAQTDPLEAIVQISLPRTGVATVGDAVAYVLMRTGYRLGPQQQTDLQANAVLSMPLPEVHRELGPYSVRTSLSVLLGTPFELSVDPAQRLVSYRSKAAPVAANAPPAGGIAGTHGSTHGSGGDR
jgi:conjugative transfer region protein (TIGR03748 family)